MASAIQINQKDNVAVVIEAVKERELVVYKDPSGQEGEVRALNSIPTFHKIAIQDIPENSPIVKYGEHIGLANRSIKAGEHVHTHNLKEYRENLKEREELDQ